jgi:hypothetical protein
MSYYVVHGHWLNISLYLVRYWYLSSTLAIYMQFVQMYPVPSSQSLAVIRPRRSRTQIAEIQAHYVHCK